MKMTLRNATLAAALAAVGATAWATTDYVTTSYSDLEKDTVVAYNEPIAVPAEPVVTETTVTTTTTTETVAAPAYVPAPAPVVERSVPQPQPPLTIEDRRLTADQRIQALVMDKIAGASNISGKIGVESNQQVVTLTGYTVTAAQGQRAGRLAGSVDGVKSVNNEIRARIGGSV
jgi:hypothetical protein